MEFIPYNSRLTYHKSPFGAVREGTGITFRIVLPRNIFCGESYLVFHKDGYEPVYIAMAWEKMQGDSEEWWTACVDAGETGLYFYTFKLVTQYGDRFITRFDASTGRITETADGDEFQLTVFDKDFQTPDSFKGSVMYQIFPDRFFKGSDRKYKSGGKKIFRNDWGEKPLWEPGKDGKIEKYDFFGGDFEGIIQKLDYLKKLGVGYIYLNPVFEAVSNHRYDTADYEKIDPVLGNEETFKLLCSEAKKHGISIILDGVFSHTGADSKYFNKDKNYGEGGAYNDRNSPYYGWYKFKSYPDEYDCWWGVDILPEIDETNDSYIEYIGKVLEKWTDAGAAGWRLDVADELPDKFLDFVRKKVKSLSPENIIIGEVWEDASDKTAYGERRRYLQGKQLDSVMNYPFAKAMISFAITGEAEGFNDTIAEICENYPKPVVDCLMNHIGTHDTCRVLNRLGTLDNYKSDSINRYEGGLNEEQTKTAKQLLMLLSTIQFTLPGVPCIYYGDEAGADGGVDPFNRGCYPWGKEDKELLSHYRLLGEIRRRHPAFADGDFIPVSSVLGCVAYERRTKSERIITVANRNSHPIVYILPDEGFNCLTGQNIVGKELYLDAFTASVSVMSCDK